MKYAIYFSLLSLGALLAAVSAEDSWIVQMILISCSVAFSGVAVAYATGRPGLLMKRDDGSQPIFAWLVLWPYFLLAHGSLLLYRLSNHRKTRVAEVIPGIWFARRLTRREFREAGVRWSAVLDLAAEFPRIASADTAYRSLPMLDGAVPSEDQIDEAVTWIDTQVTRGPLLVHCALGHGRTGMVILAWLLLQRHVPDVKTGVNHLRARRSTFGMSKAQLAALEALAARWTARKEIVMQSNDDVGRSDSPAAPPRV